MIKKRKATSSFTVRRFIGLTLFILLAILIVILANWGRILEVRINSLDNVHLQDVLIQSIDNISKPVTVDPRTGDVYFHEAHMYLPPAPGYSQLRYSINSEDPLILELNDPGAYENAVSNLKNSLDQSTTFARLPQVQACYRAYKLEFGIEDEENYALKAAVILADGRTVSIYVNEKCSANTDTLIPYIKQLKSY